MGSAPEERWMAERLLLDKGLSREEAGLLTYLPPPAQVSSGHPPTQTARKQNPTDILEDLKNYHRVCLSSRCATKPPGRATGLREAQACLTP